MENADVYQEIQPTPPPRYPVKLIAGIFTSALLFGIVIGTVLAQKGFLVPSPSPVVTTPSTIVPSAIPTRVQSPVPSVTTYSNVITVAGCPSVITAPCGNDKLPPGCGYSRMPVPASCPPGCPIICTSSSQISCSTDRDCTKEIACENVTGSCCSKGQCVNGVCYENQTAPGKCI